MPDISFNEIPIDMRTVGQFVEFDTTRAVGGLVAQPHRILVIGQRLAGGQAPAGQLVRIATADQAIQAFGRGSMLATMFAALLAANPVTETWALPLADNAAGVAATKTVTLTGPATGPGTVNLYVTGKRVQAAVATADTATVVATALAAAVNAQPDLPVTATSAAGVVTLTARHKGETGNDIDVRVNYRQGEVTPAGMTVAIAAGAAGTANPDVTAVFAAVGDEWFNSYVLPYTDAANLAVVDTELGGRWGPLKMTDGMAYAMAVGTQGALAALGAARNGLSVSIGGLKGLPTWPPVAAAAYAGLMAYNGAIDPARPFHGLTLQGVLAPASSDRFSRKERELLLKDGISTFVVDASGAVLVERPITTYQTNAFGLDSTAYLDVNTVLTLSYLRYSVRVRIASKYPRHKLANDGTMLAPGQAFVTPKVIKAELISLARDWERSGLVEDVDQFIADLIVERDANDPNRLNVRMSPNLINQLRVSAVQIQYIV